MIIQRVFDDFYAFDQNELSLSFTLYPMRNFPFMDPFLSGKDAI